jgi:integrase
MRTCKANFNLRENSSTKHGIVYLVASINKKRLQYYTGVQVPPQYWDSKAKTIKPIRQIPEKDRKAAENTQRQLDGLKVVFENICQRIQLNGGELTRQNVKTDLDEIYKPDSIKENDRPQTFLEYFEKFAHEGDENARAKGTLVAYRSTLSSFKPFLKKIGKARAEIEHVGKKILKQYYKHQLEELKFGQNTIWKNTKHLKSLLYRAEELGYTVDSSFKSFTVKQTESPAIYLSRKEIGQIMETEMKEAHLDKVRDLFIIGCETGVRFSDLSEIKPENLINGGSMFRINSQKTGQDVFIPYTPATRRIFEKYGGRLPRMISNQKFNEYLKEICRRAGINEKVNMSKRQNGLRTSTYTEKYKLVTSHTARRSFATNAYKAGVPPSDIMKITGHKTEAAFLKYIKLSGEEHAQRIAQNPYFNQPVMDVVNQ